MATVIIDDYRRVKETMADDLNKVQRDLGREGKRLVEPVLALVSES
jgi:hypothetical protein